MLKNALRCFKRSGTMAVHIDILGMQTGFFLNRDNAAPPGRLRPKCGLHRPSLVEVSKGRPRLAPVRPTSANWARIGQIRAEIDQFGAERVRPNCAPIDWLGFGCTWPEFLARDRPKLVALGRISTKWARDRQSWPRIGLNSATVDQNWPGIDQSWPRNRQSWPELGQSIENRLVIGKQYAWNRTRFGRNRPTLAQNRPNLCAAELE